MLNNAFFIIAVWVLLTGLLPMALVAGRLLVKLVHLYENLYMFPVK